MFIVFTKHSITKLGQRKINRQFVIETAKNPDIRRPSYNYREELYKKFSKNYLKVVVKKRKNDLLVLTAHWVAKIKSKL